MAEPAAERREAARERGADAGGRPRRFVARWLPTPLLRGSALFHLAAVALVMARPGRWRTSLALAAADHLLLLAASVAPRSTLLGPNWSRLPAEAADGCVALTFDDGPDPRVTPAVLDLLDEAGAHASFFCIGRRAEAHPELVREVVRRGHRVENHTYLHSPAFAFGTPRSLGREIDRAQATLTVRAGRPPAWFRPPAGMRNPFLHGVLADRGLVLASWTRRGFDAVSRDAAAVRRRLLRGLAAGDVLLLHDGSSPHLACGRALVLEVLPAVLDALAVAGLRAVALPEAAPGTGLAPIRQPWAAAEPGETA